MPQYWLKPLGVTDPPSPVPNQWTVGAVFDRYEFMTGPATQRQPPQIGRGDRVLFHAVIHVRLFAEVEVLDNPKWRRDRVWGLRWPWVYPCRVDAWVPQVEDGPRTTDIAPQRVIGRIQAGADFAKLTPEEYASLRGELLAGAPTRRRNRLE